MAKYFARGNYLLVIIITIILFICMLQPALLFMIPINTTFRKYYFNFR